MIQLTRSLLLIGIVWASLAALNADIGQLAVGVTMAIVGWVGGLGGRALEEENPSAKNQA